MIYRCTRSFFRNRDTQIGIWCCCHFYRNNEQNSRFYQYQLHPRSVKNGQWLYNCQIWILKHVFTFPRLALVEVHFKILAHNSSRNLFASSCATASGNLAPFDETATEATRLAPMISPICMMILRCPGRKLNNSSLAIFISLYSGKLFNRRFNSCLKFWHAYVSTAIMSSMVTLFRLKRELYPHFGSTIFIISGMLSFISFSISVQKFGLTSFSIFACEQFTERLETNTEINVFRAGFHTNASVDWNSLQMSCTVISQSLLHSYWFIACIYSMFCQFRFNVSFRMKKAQLSSYDNEGNATVNVSVQLKHQIISTYTILEHIFIYWRNREKTFDSSEHILTKIVSLTSRLVFHK